ncbi:hypothetical protein LCGC14_1805260, partial [marine sediment metagenome]
SSVNSGCKGESMIKQGTKEWDDLVQEITIDSLDEIERLQREEGLTEDAATKIVVGGNKEV